jgi:hypothetical protein
VGARESRCLNDSARGDYFPSRSCRGYTRRVVHNNRSRAGVLCASLVLALALIGALVVKSNAAALTDRFFHTPNGNIECELDDGGSADVQAYCQTTLPPRSVTLRAHGKLQRCNGVGCVGNGPDNATVLEYGHSIGLGPFTCRGGINAISCTVKSGAGFEISRSGVNTL